MTIYYTYCSYETDKGTKSLYYIGFRKCPDGKTPGTDNYFGSPASPKNREFKDNPNKDKVILGVFDNKEEALAHEIWLHDLHDVAANPTFVNQAKQTSTKFSTVGMTGEKNPMFGKKGKESPNYGKKRDPKTCQQISERMMGNKNPNFGKTGGKSHSFGKKRSPETLQKMSGPRPSLAGENNPNFDRNLYDFENKELRIIETQVTRYYLCNKYGLNSGSLGEVIRGKYSHHGGWTLHEQG